MKHRPTFLVALLLYVLALSLATAQTKQESVANPRAVSIPRLARHSFTGDLFGNKVGLGFSYEYRFGKRINGFGFRTGLGLYYIYSKGVESHAELGYSVPIEANYLFFKKNHHLELGFGIVPMLQVVSTLPGSETKLFLSTNPTVAYRYQRPQGGFSFRLGVSPTLPFPGVKNTRHSFPLYPFANFGFSF